MTDAIKPPDLSGPSALDLLSSFVKRYGSAIESRRKELYEKMALLNGEFSDEMASLYDESRAIVYFEPELHRLIQAFVAEAVKPMRDALVEVTMRAIPVPWVGGGAPQGTITYPFGAGMEPVMRYPISPAPTIPPAPATAQRLSGDGDPLT